MNTHDDDFAIEYGFYAAQVKANMAAIKKIDETIEHINEYLRRHGYGNTEKAAV